MNLLHLNWFVLSLLFVFASSTAKTIQKVALRSKDVHPVAYSIYFQILVGIISIPIGINTFKIPKVDFKIWLVVLLTFSMYAGATLLYFYALKDEEISQLEIISTTRAIWFLLFGIIFFKESFTVYKLLGIILIMIGLLIISWKKQGIKNIGKPQILMLINAMLSSMGATLDKYILGYLPVGLYQVISFIVPGIMIGIFIPGSFRKAKDLIKFDKNNLIIITSALFYGLAAVFFYSSYKVGGDVSKVGPIGQSATVLTVLLGILFLKERKDVFKKIIGAISVFAGVLFIKN